jgi:hypothetical protein
MIGDGKSLVLRRTFFQTGMILRERLDAPLLTADWLVGYSWWRDTIFLKQRFELFRPPTPP